MSKNYILDEFAEEPDSIIIDSLVEFLDEVQLLEVEKKVPIILFQDGKSGAFFIECHIKAEVAIPLIDFDAAIDPEAQEQFRLQRELQPAHRSYLRMVSDAKEYRQFSDIIAEYNTFYEPTIPLKLLGGQHRTQAIKSALEDNSVSRNHGLKVYFGLTREQRNEISIIANTNIAISADLIDRMQETTRGPQLRDFCHKTELLASDEDFSDRRRADGKITVRIARMFIVNYFEGVLNAEQDLSLTLIIPYLVKPGQEDEKYLTIIQDASVWENEALLKAARQFANLHHKQMSICAADPELNSGEYRNKATSFAALSAWAFVAGYCQDKKDQLNKLYSLPDVSGKKDPLAAKIMSDSHHAKDPPTYRGLGVRYGEEDRGRVAELFLLYSQIKRRRFTKGMIETAIMNFEAKAATIKAQESRRRLR